MSMQTRTGLKVGISLPQLFPQGRVDHVHLRDFVRRAEALGFHDGWLTENILSPSFYLEPVAYMAHLAAMTEKLRLGVAVIILNTRNPVQLAKALATVDQLSGGRVTVGFGLGAGTASYPTFGVPEDRRVARFEEAIRVLKALWTEEHASMPGQFWRLDAAAMQPKPVQKPHLPIIFGGHSEPALRRAVRLADGWMAAGSSSTDESIQHLQLIRRYLDEAGRPRASFMLSKRIYIALEDDETQARERLSQALSYQYGSRSVEGKGVAATPARAIEIIGRLRDAGLDHLVLNPCYDHARQMDMLADAVVPHL
jgi:probable F420-dependent oxidoreductase